MFDFNNIKIFDSQSKLFRHYFRLGLFFVAFRVFSLSIKIVNLFRGKFVQCAFICMFRFDFHFRKDIANVNKAYSNNLQKLKIDENQTRDYSTKLDICIGVSDCTKSMI